MPSSRFGLLLLAGILFGLFLLFSGWPAVTQALEFQRQAITEGQFWRLFSGHFVHLSVAHAVLNGVGLLLLAIFLSRDIPCRDALLFIVLAPWLISAGLWWKQPTLMAYVGFSGVLHGLLYLGVVRLLPVMPGLAGTVLLLLLSRQVWEQTAAYNPDYLQSLIAGRVMPDAHLFGAIAGGLWGAYTLWRDRHRINTDKAADSF